MIFVQNAVRLGTVVLAATSLATAGFAQDATLDPASEDSLGTITIQPLDDDGDLGGFVDSSEFETGIGALGGLSLEELQALPDDAGFQRELLDITTETQERVASSEKVQLRLLDKLTGRVEDVEIARGQAATWGFLSVALSDCRYPEDNPTGDAYAFLTVIVEGNAEPVFQGWMVASSPALNAMDHARYDVWPLTCAS